MIRSMDKKDIVIVVPVYKEIIEVTERLSLEQLFRVLGDYDIIFAAPERMKGFAIEQGYKVVTFEDRYFVSTESYSQLLLSDDFYARFASYEYMLIYQLDAFVFRDELLEFCKLGYDYIGAPAPTSILGWGKIKANVGNGGFSLRKISSARYVIGQKNLICDDRNLLMLINRYEDLFFSYCGKRSDIKFNVPSVNEALKFAVDEDVKHVFRRMNRENLPFGCHGWSRYQMYPFWKQFLTDDVDKLKSIDAHYASLKGLTYRQSQLFRYDEYILHRFNRYSKERLYKLFGELLNPQNTYIIWGCGIHGKVLCKQLVEYGYDIDKVYDCNPKVKKVNGIEVIIPDWEYLKNTDCAIVISPVYAYEEIRQDIIAHGIVDNEVYIYKDIIWRIIVDYITGIVGKMKSR